MFKPLNFNNVHIPVNYDAWADFGIQKSLYRVWEGNDGKWRVLYDGNHLSNESYDNHQQGIDKAQEHYENTCKKIIEAIQ